MSQLQKTFDDINVADIFHNCLTVRQRKEFCSIADILIETRDQVYQAVREDSGNPIYTCISVEQEIYDTFISIVISRTSAFREYQGSSQFNILKVELLSSVKTDNRLRLMVLEALIGQIRVYQAG